MPRFKELNDQVSLADQMRSGDEGPIVLVNVFTIDPADEEALIKAWSHDADFMKAQPGYISTQRHKGVGGQLDLRQPRSLRELRGVSQRVHEP